jgi:hypothetical protein
MVFGLFPCACGLLLVCKVTELGEDILAESLLCVADYTCPIPGIKWWMRHVNLELHGDEACNSGNTWFQN